VKKHLTELHTPPASRTLRLIAPGDVPAMHRDPVDPAARDVAEAILKVGFSPPPPSEHVPLELLTRTHTRLILNLPSIKQTKKTRTCNNAAKPRSWSMPFV
jgi:hypothetical protein